MCEAKDTLMSQLLFLLKFVSSYRTPVSNRSRFIIISFYFSTASKFKVLKGTGVIELSL